MTANSLPQQIRTRVLNKTLGQFIRAMDLLLAEYSPQSRDPEQEANYITRLTLLLMMSRWFDEDEFCILIESSKLALPKKLQRTAKHQLSKILDRAPPGAGVIDTHEAIDDDAPPGNDDSNDASLLID